MSVCVQPTSPGIRGQSFIVPPRLHDINETQHEQNDQDNEADATAAIAEMGRAHSLSNRQRMKARRALG
jgi:hypothetical protein